MSILGEERWDVARAAHAPRHRLARSARVVHDRGHGARRRPLGLLQQHAHLPASRARAGARRARRRGAGAARAVAPRGARGDAHVVRGGEADARRSRARARAPDAALRRADERARHRRAGRSSARRCASSRGRGWGSCWSPITSRRSSRRSSASSSCRAVASWPTGPRIACLTEDRLGSLFGVRVRVTRDDEYFYVH